MRTNATQMTCRALLAAGALLASHNAAASFEFDYIGGIAAPSGGAEIVAYDKFNNRIYSASGAEVDVYNFGIGSDISVQTQIDFSSLFGGTIDSVSSVAIDPLNRGFGVALAIPEGNTTQLGEIVFFDTTSNAIINQLSVGFNPDMVTFTPDGSSILVANEGEASTDPDHPFDPEGSISILNVAGRSVGDLAGFTNANVETYNFAPANLANPSDLAPLRIDPRNEFSIPLDLEPEYISVSGDKAYVTLQENSAVAVFDLTKKQWSNIFNIDGKVQTIDASDRDGGINIDDDVFGLFMPDAIATYEVGGKTYFVTANEGDARDGVVGEEARVKSLDLSRFDPALVASLNATYGSVGPKGFQEDAALGRLRISTIDGDTDGDGDIDRLTMYGTRSFSIFDAETGALVSDSGSDFETITADLVPTLFNGQDNDPGEFDGRSDNKGPEPEGVAITTIDGTVLVAIGLERVGGIMLYDITDPTSPVFLDYIQSDLTDATGSARPEGMVWITGDDSPTGLNYLVVAFEESGTLDVYTVVPEPSSLALLGLGGLLSARRRRG